MSLFRQIACRDLLRQLEARGLIQLPAMLCGARRRGYQFIGWPPALRQERLPWLVNNDRFLILPWVQVSGLASFLLSQCLRRLRTDWQRIYTTI